MVSRYTIDVTSERLREMEDAIAEQKRVIARTTDREARATATRTLATLEEILLIMQRTHGLLVETARRQVAFEA